jgi:excisionase family DNA binding protein
MEEAKYLKPEEYADKYRIHLNTIYKLLNAGEIKGAVRIGDQWRIPESNGNEK